jgi:carbonic anhydrase
MNLKNIIQTLLLGSYLTATVGYAADPHFTYEEQAEWGALENRDPTAPIPELYPFAECGLGQKQSPVDITAPTKINQLNQIAPKYSTIPLSVTDNGHTIRVNVPSGSRNDFFIANEKYALLQFHVHAPSEHMIKGKTVPLEIHFVHAAPSGRLAVLGVLVQAGEENPEFQKILDNTVVGATNTPAHVVITPDNLLPNDEKDFFTYAGSLTTPPCTEGVDWYVLREPIEVSEDQIAQFEVFYSENARHPQDLNGRVVETLK